jgi:beta-lactam-binding protein with PASTA domain
MIINAGLNIRIEGTRNYLSGTGAVVVSQSPAAGELVPEGTVVTVTFRYLDETDN